MNWKKILGDQLFEKVQMKLKDKKITIVGFVRLAVEKYVKTSRD